jgi:hypothetical protein
MSLLAELSRNVAIQEQLSPATGFAEQLRLSKRKGRLQVAQRAAFAKRFLTKLRKYSAKAGVPQGPRGSKCHFRSIRVAPVGAACL